MAAHDSIIVVILWLVSQPFSAHSLGSLFDRQGFCDSFSQSHWIFQIFQQLKIWVLNESCRRSSYFQALRSLTARPWGSTFHGFLHLHLRSGWLDTGAGVQQKVPCDLRRSRLRRWDWRFDVGPTAWICHKHKRNHEKILDENDGRFSFEMMISHG